MRKIAFYGAISLDGFLSDEQDGLQWLFDRINFDVSIFEEKEQKSQRLLNI